MTEVTNSSCINASLFSLQFANDLHCTNFRCPRDRAGGKPCSQGIIRRKLRAKLTCDIGDKMHNVGVAFNFHELAYLDTTRNTDSSNIITSKIKQHNMFSALFRVILQLLSELFITMWIFTSLPSSS